MQDSHFQKKQKKQFEFDSAVAGVFDDMLARSVPQYNESLDLAAELIYRFVGDRGDAKIIDLGCSTATLLLKLRKKDKLIKLIGIDSSQAMIDKAKEKAAAFGAKIDLMCGDAYDFSFEDIDAISANYFLQFIRPPKRKLFIDKIYSWLKKDGIFVFGEKLACEHKKLDRILIDHYYDFKRSQGYSDYEIAAKREALENVLIPYSDLENREMIKSCGFSFIECVLRWNNFATYIAVK